MSIARQALLAQLEATRQMLVAATSQVEASLTVLATEDEAPDTAGLCPECGEPSVPAGTNSAGLREMLCPKNHIFTEAD